MSGCSWCEDGEGAKLIERARVVGVLDAFAARNRCNTPTPGPVAEGWAVIIGRLYPAAGRYVGANPDAARAAAAKAIEAGEV